MQDKAHTAVHPHIKLQGHADQLAQQQGNYAQSPSSQVSPHQGTKQQEPSKELDKRQLSKTENNPVMPPNQGIAELMVRPSDASHPSSQNSPSQPEVKPKPEVRGSGGTDKITTQEMSKIKSPGAQLFGQTSFEATGSGMGEYMKNLKERIWLAWFPYLAYQYPQDFRGADVIVSFTLDPKGQVKIVQLVDSVGSPVFASYCMEAVQRASGFGPVPREILELIGKDELEIKFGFHYR